MAIPEKEVQYRMMSPGGFLYADIINIGSNNPSWVISRAQAIVDIVNKHCRYYVQGHLPSSRTYVHVAKPDALDRSTWYLRTSHGNISDKSLLCLLGFPSDPNALAFMRWNR